MAAQPTIDWSGLAWIDYSYTLLSDDPEDEGDNSFDYRRIYLTADAPLGDGFRARVRLEAQGRSTTAQGRPAPFVKDAWVRWNYTESGHRAILGVQPPPLFEVAEATWGYRSLDKTVIDRARVRDSRDFGFRLDGPLTPGGALRYAAMVGNGNGVQPEADGQRGKHVYGQLQYIPDGPLRATLGADYTSNVPLTVGREFSSQVSAFVGAVTDAYRLGVEAFYVHDTFDDPTLEDDDGVGVSVFGVANVSRRARLIARYDYLDDAARLAGGNQHYVLGGVAVRPSPSVAVVPNVLATMPEDTEATVLGRITVDVRF